MPSLFLGFDFKLVIDFVFAPPALAAIVFVGETLLGSSHKTEFFTRIHIAELFEEPGSVPQ